MQAQEEAWQRQGCTDPNGYVSLCVRVAVDTVLSRRVQSANLSSLRWSAPTSHESCAGDVLLQRLRLMPAEMYSVYNNRSSHSSTRSGLPREGGVLTDGVFTAAQSPASPKETVPQVHEALVASVLRGSAVEIIKSIT